MTKHINFYENIEEARMRLKSTVVLYDNQPYSVLWIGDHWDDGIFRVYLMPCGSEELSSGLWPPLRNWEGDFNPAAINKKLDEWIKNNPLSPVLRKMMNSPLFNRFRPFPLGMINVDGDVYYVARQPQRHREQGLTRKMMTVEKLGLNAPAKSDGAIRSGGGYSFEPSSTPVAACIRNDYPSPDEVLDRLNSKTVSNSGVAFHRDFALLSHELGVLFLAYRNTVVGVLPSNSFETLFIGKQHEYALEAIQELNLFSTIEINQR